MESGMLIMAVVLTALLITPFIFFRDGKRKSRTKNLLGNLTDLAKAENCNVSKHEVWNDAAIGINNETHKLFYVQGKGSDLTRTVVHLDDVKRSRVSVVSRTVERKSDSQKIIEKISLVLEHKSSVHPDTLLSIYDSEVDGMILSGELQLAEKWNAVINEGLVGRVDRVGKVERLSEAKSRKAGVVG
jgi:hypothetical protein